MTVTIRKLEKTEHEYFAYCKSLCGKATYLLYFDDSILALQRCFSREGVPAIP